MIPIRIAKIGMRVLGAILIIFAAIGVLMNSLSLYAVLSGVVDKVDGIKDLPYFRPWFYLLSFLCVACFVSLAICGVQFIRCKKSSTWLWLLLIACAVEVALDEMTGRLWLSPVYGLSVGAATGISEGGLVLQFKIFFPFWAPVVAWVLR